MTKVVHSISDSKVELDLTTGIVVKVYTTPASSTSSFDCDDIAPCIHAATAKNPPVDADEFAIYDSVSTLLRKVTWSNIKATLKTYFDTLYVTAATLLGYLKLDQSTSQTITGGQPIQNTLTPSELVATDTNKKFQSLAVATYPSLTELSYVKGVTSGIQNQINGKLSTALVEEISFQDINEDIAATTYTLILSAKYACTIDELSIIAGAGTATAAIQIDGVSVTGISAVAVSNVLATAAATAANTISVASKVTLVISTPAALDNLQATLKTTRS